MTRLQALHCPSCGAPLDLKEGATRVSCSACAAGLVLEGERVSTRRPKQPPRHAEEEEERPYPEPDATLGAMVYPRFELSLVEQKIPHAVPEWFSGVELGGERFAFVCLRVVDREGRPLPQPLEEAFEALRGSLEADGDPGLAANLALERLCQRPFDHRLECAVVLFEPRHMRVTTYAAGAQGSLVWASGEEGRSMAIDGHRGALERKMLREAADHFSNGRPISLAAGDLILIASAGFLGRGGRGVSEGARVLHDLANEQLGEEPLRVVTLAKNAFWAEFQQQRRVMTAPVGDVRVAAVRAIAPPLATALPSVLEPRTVRTRRFEVSVLAGSEDVVELLPLGADQHALVWLSAKGALPAAASERAVAAVKAALAEPRLPTAAGGGTPPGAEPPSTDLAAREALQALGLPPESVRLAVLQLFDGQERVRSARHGWRAPLPLGPRGLRGDALQPLDDGGEATVHEGSRLFFPGELPDDGPHHDVQQLAASWRGGKASRLYAALAAHWKTKKTERALVQLALAALSDEASAELAGLALVTGVAPP